MRVYKEEVTITYKLSDQVVYTQKIEKGSELGSIYIYESINHQSYCSTWMDDDGTIYENTTVINSDITLMGEPRSSLILFTTPENEFVFVNGFNHVHSDGKVVILSSYYDKAVNIGVGAISNDENIKELYLPSTLNRIYDNNFVDCPNLTTIYFEGDENTWSSIPNSSDIPDTVSLVFNSSFQLY